MPTPDRTSLDDIVRAGRDILEAEGASKLTMQAVASRVGVRAPSLYKRVKSRDELIGLIAESAVNDLALRLKTAATIEPAPDAREHLIALAHEFRAFALANPAGFHLMFTPSPDLTRPDVTLLARAAHPIMEATAQLAGPDHALEAARTVTAWANGFISMELAGAFQLGGDVDRAFEFGITRLAAALAA
ncbi:TetR/AcrR family transcriptional regulator [Subtercola endophyticus]|uniref:TetR/AcrR family transcriptional regulator n=1 Tax=Subtercola endophyticus TaxID=2895559 RepID=UPI001E63EA60|nr:TetR/AcrR family transcriptional regulator [Subtercola endophyticus]UFS58871.1 TetR/AcrR family transcriptional regulator [Subtercola endophyticus]